MSNLRERVMSRLSEKKGWKTRAPIPSFFFSFFWEKRFESLNFSDLFFLLIYSFSLSLSFSTSNHFASPQNFASFGREEEEEEEKRWCVFVFVSRERDGAK